MSVARAAAVLADRQLVGFPKTTATPPFRNWYRLTVVGDQVILNVADDGGSRSPVSGLDIRKLSLTNTLPLTAVYAEVAAREDLAALRSTGFYLSFVGEKLVALVGHDFNFTPPFPQSLVFVDRHQWPKVLAVFPLGRVQDLRVDEGPSYLSGAAFLGDRLFLGLPRWTGPNVNQLEEPLISSGLGEFSVSGLPPRNFATEGIKFDSTDDLHFSGENLLSFHTGEKDSLIAWRERNGAWEVAWKRFFHSRPIGR